MPTKQILLMALACASFSVSQPLSESPGFFVGEEECLGQAVGADCLRLGYAGKCEKLPVTSNL